MLYDPVLCTYCSGSYCCLLGCHGRPSVAMATLFCKRSFAPCMHSCPGKTIKVSRIHMSSRGIHQIDNLNLVVLIRSMSTATVNGARTKLDTWKNWESRIMKKNWNFESKTESNEKIFENQRDANHKKEQGSTEKRRNMTKTNDYMKGQSLYLEKKSIGLNILTILLVIFAITTTVRAAREPHWADEPTTPNDSSDEEDEPQQGENSQPIQQASYCNDTVIWIDHNGQPIDEAQMQQAYPNPFLRPDAAHFASNIRVLQHVACESTLLSFGCAPKQLLYTTQWVQRSPTPHLILQPANIENGDTASFGAKTELARNGQPANNGRPPDTTIAEAEADADIDEQATEFYTDHSEESDDDDLAHLGAAAPPTRQRSNHQQKGEQHTEEEIVQWARRIIFRGGVSTNSMAMAIQRLTDAVDNLQKLKTSVTDGRSAADQRALLNDAIEKIGITCWLWKIQLEEMRGLEDKTASANENPERGPKGDKGQSDK